MKEKQETLNVFNFSHPLIQSEMLSLEGDKYSGILPFAWKFVPVIEEAQVVVWDGVVTPKNKPHVTRMLESVKDKKVLLVLGESLTLFKDHPIVSTMDVSNLRTVEVPGWSALPEEILTAFEACREKLGHV